VKPPYSITGTCTTTSDRQLLCRPITKKTFTIVVLGPHPASFSARPIRATDQ
jgi:hypothetical protein